MEVKDLRIGNFIQDIESGRIGRVLTIGKKKCAVKMPFSELTQDYDDFQSIELTEEWLQKFGYEKIDGLNRWFSAFQGRWYFMIKDSGKWYLIFNFEGKDYKINQTGIYFLHQFQNLISSLTGEELTINEDNELI